MLTQLLAHSCGRPAAQIPPCQEGVNAFVSFSGSPSLSPATEIAPWSLQMCLKLPTQLLIAGWSDCTPHFQNLYPWQFCQNGKKQLQGYIFPFFHQLLIFFHFQIWKTWIVTTLFEKCLVVASTQLQPRRKAKLPIPPWSKLLLFQCWHRFGESSQLTFENL